MSDRPSPDASILDKFDILQIAYRTDPETIHSLCRTNSRFNQIICRDPYFWGSKAVYDRLLTETERSEILSTMLKDFGVVDIAEPLTKKVEEAIRDKFYRIYFNKLGERDHAVNKKIINPYFLDLLREGAPIWKFFMFEGAVKDLKAPIIDENRQYQGEIHKELAAYILALIFKQQNIKRRDMLFSIFVKIYHDSIVEAMTSIPDFFVWIMYKVLKYFPERFPLEIFQMLEKAFGTSLPPSEDDEWIEFMSEIPYYKVEEDDLLLLFNLMLPYIRYIREDYNLVDKMKEEYGFSRVATAIENAVNTSEIYEGPEVDQMSEPDE